MPADFLHRLAGRGGRTVAVGPHGSATPPNFASAVNDIMGQFAQSKDVGGTANALQQKAQQFLTS